MQSAATSTRTRAPRVLILGGTTEASELATHLAARSDVTVISSLAGRVSQPRLPVGMVRLGGFGGVAGLISYLVDENIGVVVDATHPYASKISGNAELACNALSLPLIALERPAWEPNEHDCWCAVPDAQAAASMVNHQRNRVFLSIGRQELGAFSDCEDAWFLVRAIDAPSETLPAKSKLILKRGPFHLNDELRMLRSESISIIVSKNSGGTATYPKIEAARTLGIPVVMIDRPRKHHVPTVPRPDDVLQKLAQLLCMSPTAMLSPTE
ncbi:MAG: cobalt-precorrin-6A reductase [Acidobacteriaceae bacterium]